MIKYLDTCLPDYFQGFSGLHVYAVPVSNDDTYQSVLDTLSELINHEEIYGFEDSDYEALEQSFQELKTSWADYAEKIFDSNAPDYEADSFAECYAYFGIETMTDNPLFALLFIPIFPHTINLVSCMFYMCTIAGIIGMMFEKR